MGKKRVTVMGEKKEEKVHLPGLKGGQRIAVVEDETDIEPQTETTTKSKTKKAAKTKIRSQKYQNAKALVDPTKVYPLSEAIKLLKKTAYGQFLGSAEIHLVMTKKNLAGEVSLPHFEAKSKVIEIADEKTLAKIEAGKIDFDVLLATPAFMPNLVKYAKVLGPKGLMPNPKNQTLTDNPEESAKKLAKTSLTYKTEANAPLIHAVFGKVNQPEEELEANLKAFLKAVDAKNILRAIIKSTMGPAIKITLVQKQSTPV